MAAIGWLLFTLVVSLFLTGAFGAPYYCNTRLPNTLCLYGSTDAYGNKQLTIHSSAIGWAGFGVGTGMSTADMFSIWLNSRGAPMLSRRSPRGHSMPPYNPNYGGARLVTLQTSIQRPAWARLAVTVQLPTAYNNYPSLTFIFASSDTRVSMPDSINSAFPNHHGSKGRTTPIEFPRVTAAAPAPAVAGNGNGLASATRLPPAPRFTGRALESFISIPSSTLTSSNRAAGVSAPSYFCEKGQTFCFYGQPDSTGKYITFTIHSAADGWAGFGIGSSMLNADMYVGWMNSTRGYTVSRRSPNGYHTPTMNADLKELMVVPLAVPAPAWSKLSFSVRRTLDDPIRTGKTYIYAYTTKKATIIDNPASHYSKHDVDGKIEALDFMSQSASAGPVVQSTSSNGRDALVASDDSTYRMIIQLHGIFMFAAWIIAPFIGIFIARYLKDALGVYWYRLHLGIMFGGTGLLSLLGFILVVLYGGSPHFEDLHVSGVPGQLHGKLGLVIIVSTIIQIVLGFVSNAMWTPDREYVPVLDKVHWWVGRLLFLIGIVNVAFGLQVYIDKFDEGNGGLMIGFWTVLVVGILAMIYGQWKFGQINHVAGRHGYKH